MLRRQLAYIGDVSAVARCYSRCSGSAESGGRSTAGGEGARRELLIAGSGIWVHITDAASQQELWAAPVLQASRVHGVHSCWRRGTASSEPLLVLAVWGGCKLVLVGLQLGSAATPDGSISISCLHQQRLPRTACWVLDALLVLPPAPAPASSTAGTQQQQMVAADLQLIVLSMDNTCAVWSLELGQGQQWRIACTAVVACDSRACLYSGALHHQPAQQQQQQQQQQHPVVWVASGTAFGDTLLWRLPATALTAAAPGAPTTNTPSHSVERVSFQLRGHEGSVHRVVWGPADAESLQAAGDGVAAGEQQQLLGTCSDDRSVRVWRVALHTNEQQQQPLPVDLEPAAILWGHTARVWDIAFIGQQRRRPEGGQPAGSSTSASRHLIATSGEDSCCRLWSVDTGQQLAVLQAMGRAWRCCFLPASCQLAAATADGGLRVWPLQQWLGSSRQQQLEHGQHEQHQQQFVVRQCVVPAACCRPGFQPRLACSSSGSGSSSSAGPLANGSMQEGKVDAVQALCLPHPSWLLVATKSGRLHAVDLLPAASGVPSQQAQHPAAATPPWYQLYQCPAGGPFLCMKALPARTGCDEAAAGWRQCRVALGHRAGLVAVLDVSLPPNAPAETHTAARPAGAAGSQEAPYCAPGGPACPAAVLWQAHAPHELLQDVFAPAALGCCGLITAAVPTAVAPGRSRSKDQASGHCNGSSRRRPQVARIWLLPPPAGAGSSTRPDEQQQQQQQQEPVGCGGSDVNSNGSTSAAMAAAPLLLAEACMPAARTLITAAEVVVLGQAGGAGAGAAAALLVLGDDGGGVSCFRLPLWCLDAVRRAAGLSTSSSSSCQQHALPQQQQQQQQQQPVQQLELLQRFDCVHGHHHVTCVQATSSTSSAGRGGQQAMLATAGAAAEWVTAGRDGNTARFLATALDDACANVQVVMAAAERLPSAIMVVEHMASLAAPAQASSNTSSSTARPGQPLKLLLGFKGADVVAFDTAAAAPLWVLGCGGMRRPHCFWHGDDAGRSGSMLASAGGMAAAEGVLLQFAFNAVGGIGVVQYAALQGCQAGSGGGSAAAALATAAGGSPAAVAHVAAPACRPASSSAVLSGHHSREVLAAVLLAGPAGGSGAGAAEHASVLLTGSEDGTVRATVIQPQQQHSERAQLQTHTLGVHASGAAVRCLAAFRLPQTSRQLQLQGAAVASGWLVVAGCTQEVMLAWQVGWVVASDEGSGSAAAAGGMPQLTWQLVGSLAPLRTPRRPRGRAHKAAVEARCLAVSIVGVHSVPAAGHCQAGAAAAGADAGTVAAIASSLSGGAVQLLRLALPQSSWSTLAVLEPPGGGPSSSCSLPVGSCCFAHPVLSMACLQLPAAASAGLAACGPTCLLAAGASDGSVLLYDATQLSREAVAATAAASSEAARLRPLLSLPGLHQAGVNSVLLLRRPPDAAGDGADAAAAEQAAASLLLVTAGDDQALAATQLLLTTTSLGRLQLQQGGTARVDNAHASSLRTVVEVGGARRRAPRVLTTGLDQRCSLWDIILPPAPMNGGGGSGSSDACGAGPGGGAATCARPCAPSLRHVCSWLTEVPEPAAASLLALPLIGTEAKQEQQHLLAVCGRGLQLETITAPRELV